MGEVSSERAGPPILIVPGFTRSGPEHLQSLWELADPRMQRVEQRDWEQPDCGEWTRTLADAVARQSTPPILVAHSLGCIAVAHWAAAPTRRVAGALLVAPADVERDDAPEPIRNFAPVPLRPLPFPSIVVASTDDPYALLERVEAFAAAWGSTLVEIGAAGHVNTDAGFGRWPLGEALLRRLIAETAG